MGLQLDLGRERGAAGERVMIAVLTLQKSSVGYAKSLVYIYQHPLKADPSQIYSGMIQSIHQSWAGYDLSP